MAAGWCRAELVAAVEGEGGGALRGPARGAGLRRTLGGQCLPEPAASRECPPGLGEAGRGALGTLPGVLLPARALAGALDAPGRCARRWNAARASRTRTGRPGGARRFLVQRAVGPPLRQPRQALRRLPEMHPRLPGCSGAYVMSHYPLASGSPGRFTESPGRLFRRIFRRACRGPDPDASPLGKRPAAPVEGQAGARGASRTREEEGNDGRREHPQDGRRSRDHQRVVRYAGYGPSPKPRAGPVGWPRCRRSAVSKVVNGGGDASRRPDACSGSSNGKAGTSEEDKMMNIGKSKERSYSRTSEAGYCESIREKKGEI